MTEMLVLLSQLIGVQVTSSRSRAFQLQILLLVTESAGRPAPADPVVDIELETFYRSIPASRNDTDAFEYTWVIEDYVHNIPSTVVPPR